MFYRAGPSIRLHQVKNFFLVNETKFLTHKIIVVSFNKALISR